MAKRNAKKPTPPKPLIRFDKFVESVRPDPKSTPILTVLNGYIGKSSELGNVRVYQDESCNHFIEIPQDAIVHAEANSYDDNALGGSKLWVRADAVYTYGDPSKEQRPKGTFLQGSLYDSYNRNPQFPPRNPGPTSDLRCTEGADCQTLHFACPPSEYETGCKSVLFVCPSRDQQFNTCQIGCLPCTKEETRCYELPTKGGKSICYNDTCFIGCFDCTKEETNCVVWPTRDKRTICFNDTCNIIICFQCTKPETNCVPVETQYKGCTDIPDCPNGRTCVKTCNGEICLRETSPNTCITPTIQAAACRAGGPGGTFRNPGYGFGTFNPYQY